MFFHCRGQGWFLFTTIKSCLAIPRMLVANDTGRRSPCLLLLYWWGYPFQLPNGFWRAQLYLQQSDWHFATGDSTMSCFFFFPRCVQGINMTCHSPPPLTMPAEPPWPEGSWDSQPMGGRCKPAASIIYEPTNNRLWTNSVIMINQEQPSLTIIINPL